ncbi:MAG: acetyl-CoA decarbonylase/synthase complex subunit alpha/beta [Armatimonadota bacterium]
MSKIIAAAAIRGAHAVVGRTRSELDAALAQFGATQAIGWPELTAFHLPMITALTGQEISNLGQAKSLLEDEITPLLAPIPDDEVWLPYLAGALDAGGATLMAEEISKALGYLNRTEPAKPGWFGFISDTIQRTLGIQLVDGRMPGFAAIIGAAPDVEKAVHIVRELQKRSILVFLLGNSNGVTLRDQLIEGGVYSQDILEHPEQGWDTYVVPVGPDTESLVYVLSWAARAALIFGGIPKGDVKGVLDYTRAHTYAFGLGLGELDDLKYANGAGAIIMGFPVVADTPGPEIRPTGVCTYEEVVRELDHQRLVETAVQVRGLKVTVRDVNIPVPVAAAFEGETVRREDMQVEFGGKNSFAMEFLRTRPADDIQDGKVEVIGDDVDVMELGSSHDLALLIEVAGRKLQEDFEPILERQTHLILNHAMGIFHMGQRDLPWIRISKEAYHAGFRLRHFGDLLISELKHGYGALLDKVQVTVVTDKALVDKIHGEARQVWNARDARIAGMTDETVDTYYSCTLCQSYAPTHVCVITPERLGLCGAYNWLDGKAAFEINPTGGNQPIPKGVVLDEKRGEFKGINEFVHKFSQRNVERVCLYSMMEAPMTSCGCFEVILSILPEANGIMAVNREYRGMTPCGMPFTTLAGSVGGGNVTPGFLGVGRLYLGSPKFIQAEGGIQRLVWLPKELKDALRDSLVKQGEAIGLPDLVDRIADETVGTTSEEIMPWLMEKEHPALTMEPMF